jgi:hypothetical protein
VRMLRFSCCTSDMSYVSPAGTVAKNCNRNIVKISQSSLGGPVRALNSCSDQGSKYGTF